MQSRGFYYGETSICGGCLVAELPKMEFEREEHDIKHCPLPEESYALPPYMDMKSWEVQAFKDNQLEMYRFTAEKRLNAINISRSLAMAYVMDQLDYNFFFRTSLLWIMSAQEFKKLTF